MTDPITPPNENGTFSPVVAKILVADDEPRNLQAVAAILQSPGLDLVLVNSGEEVLRHILREDFAVILLDVRMPRIDGYEVAAMIRSRPRSARVPILFVTAYNKDELHVFRGYSAGAVDFVFKPIEPLILKSKVDVFVDLYRKTEELRVQHSAEKSLLIENLRVRSEKLDMERALRLREEHQSLVLQGLPVALYKASVDVSERTLRFTGDSIEKMTGFASEDFEQPRFWETHVHAEDKDAALSKLAAVLESEGTNVEYRWRCADGSERHILDRAVPIRDENGVAGEVYGMWFDVSERKELEHRLSHASKLEAIGRLTGGVAHDFNNMLNIVMGNLDLLLSSMKDDPKATRRIEHAIQGAQRCADLTSRLLAFSRRSPLQPVVIQPGSVMPGIMELLRRALGERVVATLDLAEGLPSVRVDQSQFESAMVNLAVNARDAMPDGGTLSIRCRRVEPTHVSDDGPGRLEILVADTGVGMAPEVVKRVFEPFFTTKEIGKGTGLGLSMVYGFVQQSGGEISLDSSVGCGTTVTISLPGVHEPDAATPPLTAPTPPPLGVTSSRALVVEDDTAVRHVATSTLEALGFIVNEASTAEDALKLLEQDSGVGLVFSDITMPGALSGIELGRAIRARWPSVPVLLASGFMEEQEGLEEFEVLQKPYRTSELVDRLNAIGALRTNA